MSQHPFDREPDDLDIALQAMGDLLAAIPHQLGYRLEDSDQLAIQLSGPNTRSLIALDWRTDEPDLEAARQAAKTIKAIASSRSTDAILLLGYGSESAERVYALREALQIQIVGTDTSIAAVQVDHDRWRAFGIGVTGDWHRMPEVPVSIMMDGYPAPAASLQEYRNRYEPLPEPTYRSLPESSRDLIDSSPPGIRAELATRALQRIADRTPHPLDQAAIAHVLTDPAVNHSVVADAYKDRAHLSALIDTYRGAPEQHRPALAYAAATALWLHGRIREAQHVNIHIPDNDYYATGRDHLTTLITDGMDPKQLAPRFAKAAETHLNQAEATWAAGQVAAPDTAPGPGSTIDPPQRRQLNDPDL